MARSTLYITLMLSAVCKSARYMNSSSLLLGLKPQEASKAWYAYAVAWMTCCAAWDEALALMSLARPEPCPLICVISFCDCDCFTWIDDLVSLAFYSFFFVLACCTAT